MRLRPLRCAGVAGRECSEGIMDEIRHIKKTKPEAILEAIRNINVGDNVIIHNADGTVWSVLKLICREHEEN